MRKIGEQIVMLDSGYVSLVDNWGGDEDIIRAARMSTDKGFEGWGPKHRANCRTQSQGVLKVPICDCGLIDYPEGDLKAAAYPGDERLLAYLYNHKHMTPFEMAGMVIEVKAPIFVFREWHRHRTQSYNEMSARYIPLPDENYMPSIERCQMLSKLNKQAQSANVSDDAVKGSDIFVWQQNLADLYEQAQRVYDHGLKLGIPKELARLPVPVARYSRMRASANLRNWLAFLTLRMDEAAQWEIRQYANAVGSLIAERFPRTWALFSSKE